MFPTETGSQSFVSRMQRSILKILLMQSDPNNAHPDHTRRLLARIAAGEADGEAELYKLLYDELHLLAGRVMHGQEAGHTLQATALVNETYLKLADGKLDLRDRGHFLSLAARVMRQILVDHARGKHRNKRAAPGERLMLDALVEGIEERGNNLVEMDDALKALAERDERAARIVELRFFGGLTVRETADALDITVHRVEDEWAIARAWLSKRLR